MAPCVIAPSAISTAVVADCAVWMSCVGGGATKFRRNASTRPGF